jgi:hypothetical protein
MQCSILSHLFLIFIGLPCLSHAQESPLRDVNSVPIFSKINNLHNVTNSCLRYSTNKSTISNHNIPSADLEAVYTTEFARNYMAVFPNPSTVLTHFSLSPLFSLQFISFYNIMGKQVFPSYTVENNNILCNIHDLASGIYMVHISWTTHVYWMIDANYSGSFSLPFIIKH